MYKSSCPAIPPDITMGNRGLKEQGRAARAARGVHDWPQEVEGAVFVQITLEVR